MSIALNDKVIFAEPCECEVFQSVEQAHNGKGVIQIIEAGALADVVDAQENSQTVQVQFDNGDVTLVNQSRLKKFN